MFFGEYQHNLDTKGRLSIPAKFRGECGDHVYIMRGHEGCLDVYTEEGWQTYYAELKKLSNKVNSCKHVVITALSVTMIPSGIVT